MIEVPQFSDKTVAVMGLGRSGLAAAEALMASGAGVWAWDDVDGVRRKAHARGVPLVDLTDCDWSQPAALVLSPGIPLHYPAPHAVVQRARAAGCEIVGDVELLARAQTEARFVGVTGTNGKSTTTALIAHIFEAAGLEAQVGGNLGTPALALEPLNARGTYVLEISSFQLDLTFSAAFDVAILLNIFADHLDRHGDMDGYVAAKRRIFRNQGPTHTAVVGVDDGYSRQVYDDIKADADRTIIPVSGRRPVEGGVYVVDGWLYDDTDGRGTRAANLDGAAALPGAHNWQNASAAYAAARSVGADAQAIAAGIQGFPGLPHRQERIAVVDGVRYVNDSKATNADATAEALACYTNAYWIAGGRPKEGGIAGLSPWFGNIAHAFLIGEAADGFAGTLRGKVPFTRSGDLATATRQAAGMARSDGRPDPVVLLSPACASFDQFEDFEARGEAFRALVAALPGEHQGPGHRAGAGDRVTGARS
ncbi:MAG: UDP-N-acetylmuramoyl-L-alanine--D-glutamate ligase [Alphaproteobacteria bacterium]